MNYAFLSLCVRGHSKGVEQGLQLHCNLAQEAGPLGLPGEQRGFFTVK